MPHLQSALGIIALLAVAWAFGENRRAVSLRQAAVGLAVTLSTAVVYMASLPLDANVLFMTVMASKMPFVGRG